jgi:transcriptional regulator with XRE-family HTH domain
VDFIGLAPKHFDAALGAVLTAAMQTQGWSAQKVAVFARLRPRAVRRILAGKTSAGTVQLHRLLRVLQLDYAATMRAAYIEAEVAQLAADTEAAEQRERTRDVPR